MIPQTMNELSCLPSFAFGTSELLGRAHKCFPPYFTPSAWHRSQATHAAGVAESQLLGEGQGAPSWAGRPQDTEEPAAPVVGPAVHRACQWPWPCLCPASSKVIFCICSYFPCKFSFNRRGDVQRGLLCSLMKSCPVC